MPNDFSSAGESTSAEHTGPDAPRDGFDETRLAGEPVVVRRHAGVAALIGAAASAVAIAYLWRASQTMTTLDWTLCAVMAVIAAYYLVSLVDARTPLLVADDLGVRIRLGDEWRGLPWDAIGQVVVHPRRGVLRDGRLVFLPRSLARALDGLDAKGRRHVALNQKMYGAALAVPVGTTTRVSTGGERSVADEIAGLALGRAEVVELDPRSLEVADRGPGTAEDDTDAEPTTAPGTHTGRATDGNVVEGQVVADPGDEEPPADAAPAPVEGRREVFPRLHTGERVPRFRPGGATTGQQPLDAPATPVPADQRSTAFDSGQRPAEGPSSRSGADAGQGDVTDRPDLAESAETDTPAPGEPHAPRAPRRSILGGIGTIVSRVAKGRSHDVDDASGRDPAAPELAEGAGVAATEGPADGETSGPGPLPLAPTAALRETRPGLRAEATLNLPTAGSNALDPELDHDDSRVDLREGRELRRPGSVDLVFERVELDDRVRPISTLGDPVAPLVIDDYVTEPAYDPVIGPELAAARTRLGLTVDDLAERTRIRPHVIESIEVDDFAPCGGDFYARGHLRTLARILGKDVAPLLEKFEERYATAPINARRVFEAELATGMTGSMRSTVGGPSWGLLVGVVLVLVLVWGVLRLFTTEPPDMPAPVINGSAVVRVTTAVDVHRPATP